MRRIYGVVAGARAPLAPAELRTIGTLALQVPPTFVGFYAAHLPGETWPARFRAAVVNAEKGQLRLLGPSDAVPLAVGVAASCAAPGIAPAVALPDGLYVDGGARSATNADTLRERRSAPTS